MGKRKRHNGKRKPEQSAPPQARPKDLLHACGGDTSLLDNLLLSLEVGEGLYITNAGQIGKRKLRLQ